MPAQTNSDTKKTGLACHMAMASAATWGTVCHIKYVIAGGITKSAAVNPTGKAN
jgi:hypothetical protein